MPQTNFQASKDFDAFLLDVRDTCMLQTHHQAYHTLKAVLHCFRGHFSVKDALVFANVLPAVTRAVFIEDWEPEHLKLDEPGLPFPDRIELTREVKAIRRDHNLAPDTAISDVAAALRRSAIDTAHLDLVLRQLPKGAAEFWA